MNRNLDGCYFRVQRGYKWQNICFSDLTKDERDAILDGKSAEWLRSLVCHLADQIALIGEQLNIAFVTGGDADA